MTPSGAVFQHLVRPNSLHVTVMSKVDEERSRNFLKCAAALRTHVLVTEAMGQCL